jgi:hypothetical protein
MSKEYFFSENFRSLEKGWKQARQVNFLVGESSSGKTSWMYLMKILTSQGFNLGMNISDEFDFLTSPSDLISRKSGKKEVSVGFVVEDRFPAKDSNHLSVGRIAT